MNWYKNIKTAKEEIGHGDTLYGQQMKQEIIRLTDKVSHLRLVAAGGGPDSILPRWKGEVRNRILLLPGVEVIKRMSNYEVHQLKKQLELIENTIEVYSIKRFKEITDANNSR